MWLQVTLNLSFNSIMAVEMMLQWYLLILVNPAFFLKYTVNNKKGGRTFVIITLETLDAFL